MALFDVPFGNPLFRQLFLFSKVLVENVLFGGSFLWKNPGELLICFSFWGFISEEKPCEISLFGQFGGFIWEEKPCEITTKVFLVSLGGSFGRQNPVKLAFLVSLGASFLRAMIS